MPARKPESCPHRKRLGKNVATLRARRDLTQEKLAEKVGVSARYIQNVEAGDSFPGLPTLVTLHCNKSESSRAAKIFQSTAVSGRSAAATQTGRKLARE